MTNFLVVLLTHSTFNIKCYSDRLSYRKLLLAHEILKITKLLTFVMNNKMRCFGNDSDKKFLADYHDQKLFELLILEGAQAGLNWEMILKKRKGYSKAFHNFDPVKVAQMKIWFI